jgi:hypothetical protein
MPIDNPQHAQTFKTIEARKLVWRRGGHFEQFYTIGIG